MKPANRPLARAEAADAKDPIAKPHEFVQTDYKVAGRSVFVFAPSGEFALEADARAERFPSLAALRAKYDPQPEPAPEAPPTPPPSTL